MDSSNPPGADSVGSLTARSNALERVSSAVLSFDKSNQYTYVNQRAAEILDIDPEAVLGEHIWDGFPTSQGTQLQRAIERPTGLDKDNAVEWHDSELNCWFEGQVYSDETGVSLFFTEITEQRERQHNLDRAETLFENSQDGLFVIDVEEQGETFRVNRVNQAYEALTGASADELHGKTIRTLAGDDDSETIRENYHECVARQDELRYEEQLSIFGDESWWETRISPVIIDGEVVQLVGSTRNITEQKERESRLRKYEQIVQQTGHAVFFTNADGEIQYVNPAFEQVTGYTSGDALGETPSLLKSGEHDDAFFADLWETVLARDVWRGEIVNERKDGTQFTARHTIAPVTNESGDVTNFVAIYNDITERKEREAQLRRKTRALDNAPVGISITDPSQEDNPMTYVNEEYTEITGYEKDEAIGRNCRFLQGRETDPEQVGKIRDAIDEPRDIETTLRNYRKDGTAFWNELSIAPVRDEDGTLESFVGFQKDITERKKREKRLQTHELVVQTMNEAAFLVDDKKQIQFANDTALEFADISLESIKGVPIEPVTEEMAAPDEDVQRFLDAIDSVLSDEESDVGKRIREPNGVETLTLEFDLRLESAGDICAEQRLVPVELYDDRRGVVVISRDITERKEKEREIHTHLVQAQEVGHVGSWYLEIEAGDLSWSDECYRIFGLSPDQPMTYERFLEFVHPDDREGIQEAWEAALDGEPYNKKHRIVVDGETRWVHETADVEFDDDGQPVSGIGVVRDITDQVERERKINEQRKRYESLFNSIQDPIVVTDATGRITDCNPGLTDLFGYELDDIKGSSLQMLVADDEDSTDLTNLTRKPGEELSSEVRTVYQKKCGQEFTGESTISQFQNPEGDIVGFINQIRDISERERNIQQLKVVDRVLRHNIRNDMNALMGHAELIQNKGSPEVQPHVSKILDVGQSFVETAEKQRKVTTVLTEPSGSSMRDIVPTVESAVTEIQRQHPEADVSVQLPETCWVLATSDIDKAFRELLRNAVIHSDSEHPTVTVDVRAEDGTVAIRISDNGPGIPEPEWEIINREAEIDPLYHGSGLGLWLVREIIRQSDGWLAFEENSPAGSTVTVRLPTE
ncbi:MAG: PAS domain S-box protein [Haloarculaceae archaeon]